MKIPRLFALIAFTFFIFIFVAASTFSTRASSEEVEQPSAAEGRPHLLANTFDSWFIQYIFNAIFSDGNYRRIESNGLRGTYFADDGTAVFSRVDRTVDFDWENASPSSYLLEDDNFAAIWEGEVVPDASGTYTFEVTADDGVRLYIDDELVLESWENQPEATHVGSVSLVEGRRHSIRLEYYEAHSLASVSLKWRSATQSLEVVPHDNLHPAQSPASQAPEDFPNDEPADSEEDDSSGDEQGDGGNQWGGSDEDESEEAEPGTGLRATFFDYDGNRLASRIDDAIDFNWGRRSPANNVPSDYFTAVWEGEIRPEYSEEYSFTASIDDGVRLYIDDELIIESWKNQPTTDYTGSIRLTAGEYYDIRFEYYEANWHAEARLQWQSASQRKEVVPQENLYPSASRGGGVDRDDSDEGDSGETGGGNDDGEDGDSNSDAGAVGMSTVTFTADTTTDFPNPERGWMTYHTLTGDNPLPLNGDPTTLVHWFVNLEDYRYSALPQSFLNRVAGEFEAARDSGKKLIVRVRYDNTSRGADAPFSRVMQHIEQLGPVITEYQDIIASLDAGFIGAWGEWHSSANNLVTGSDRNGLYREQILEKLLDVTPETMMVTVRYPWMVYEWNNTPLSASERFTGTDKARVGALNDCFMAGRTNGGTYSDWDGPSAEEDRRYWERMTPYVVMGGETCDLGGLTSYNDASGAIAELEDYHWDYLNSEWWEDMLMKWSNQGRLNEISRKLGYRLRLTEATLPTRAASGQEVSVVLKMTNDGYGKVFNPRPIDLILRSENGVDRRVRLTSDARRDLPLAGESKTLRYTADLPNLAEGEYDLRLALPDPSDNLEDDPRYAIRLANRNVWSSDGTNNLGATLTIASGGGSTPDDRPEEDEQSDGEDQDEEDGGWWEDEDWRSDDDEDDWQEPQETEPGTGLRATFFDFDGNQLASRIDSEVNFNWGYNSPSSRVPDDYFTAVWEGQVRTESSGTHKFQVTADDGVRLYVDDELIIEDWTSHPSRTYTGSINLGEGKHDIRLEYFENHSIAELRLRWQENGRFVAIPQENLYPHSSGSSDPGRDVPVDDDDDNNDNEEDDWWDDDDNGGDNDNDDDNDDDDQGGGSPAPAPSGSSIGPQEVRSTSLSSGDYFVSPSGSGGSCSRNSPCSISTAISSAGPGDVVFLRGGVYRVGGSGIRFNQSGRSGAPITFESYPGELAVFDGSSHSDGSDVYIRVTGDWNVVRRIEIRNMPRSGIWIGGNHNLIDGVVSHGNYYSGIHVFSPYNSYPYGDYGSYNTIQNSTTYNNFDEGSSANGGDADGIAVSSGEGNKVFNNRVYYNSDDGIDVWRSTNSEVAYNIVYDNGRANGNGNGIKSGGQSPSRGTLVHHNIAYGNEQTGIDYNLGEDVTFYNNTSYNNGYGYSGDDGVLLRNNISFENGRNWVSNARQDHNSWNGGVSVSSSDFLSLDPDSSNFLKLAPGSDLIDAGVSVGFDYEGGAPDLGALEY